MYIKKRKQFKGVITYYLNDVIVGSKNYRSKIDRDKSINSFLERIKKLTSGLLYYIISPKIILPDETVKRNIQKHKALRGYGGEYGKLIPPQTQRRLISDKK